MLATPDFVPSTVLGADGGTPPSERIAVGLIGKGVMGSVHLQALLGEPRVQVVAVCDVDRQRREAGKKAADERYAADPSRGCAAYNDYRELLARADIDAVVIATPDHWHALQAVDAAKAGKDIYCEKPISMTIREGRRVVEAVRRYGRVFQTGTQYRSNPTIRKVCQFVRDGGLGKIKSVFTLFQNARHLDRRAAVPAVSHSVIERRRLRQARTCRWSSRCPPSRCPRGSTGTCGSARRRGIRTTASITPIPRRAWCRGRSARASA